MENKEEVAKKNKEFLHNILDNLKSYKNTYEICFPSVHVRRPSLLDKLEEFKDCKVNVFVYEYEKDLYKFLDEYSYINKVIVPDEYITVMKMRKFIQNYMGDKTYWVLDDDVEHFFILPEREIIDGKPTKVKYSIPDGLKFIEQVLVQSDASFAIATASLYDMQLAHYNYLKLFSECTIARQIALFNGKLLRENNIFYTGDTEVNEDLEIYLDVKKKRLPVLTCRSARCSIPVSGDANSIESTASANEKRVMKNYLKFGEYLDIKMKKGILTCYLKWRELEKLDGKIDRTILDFCEREDIKGLKEYCSQFEKKKKVKNNELF